MSEICVVCLKTGETLNKVDENNLENIFLKLTNCVPEIEWKRTFHICQICLQDLNHAYQFRILCITSHTSLKDNINNSFIKEPVTKLESDDTSVIKTDFNDDDSHQCYECKLTFQTVEESKQHDLMFNHSDVKISERNSKVSCEYCPKLFTTKYTLKKHLIVCKKKLNENVKTEVSQFSIPTCGICRTTFRNKYLLKRHMLNVHASEKKYKCELCGRTFASPVYLNAHKRYHTGERSHICSFCGKGFITASDLYHHEKIHANKRSYRCEICPKAFNTSSDLHKHRMCVHQDRTKWKYACAYCDKRFPLKTNLDAHTKIHTGEKNFSCHLCDRKCISKFVLAKHIEAHTNIINFKCEICLQGYKHKKSLQLHMTKVHGVGNAKIPEKIRKFICHLCPKSYFANSKLQKHIRSHSGDRPFHCTLCSKSFVDKYYIKQHLKNTHNLEQIKTEF